MNKTLVLVLIAICAATAGLTGVAQNKRIEDFVRQSFIHGVQYEDAAKYAASNVPILLKMLQNPPEEQNWPNIVVTLAIIDGDQAVDPLISFVSQGGSDTLSRVAYVAKTSTVMALGYTVNKDGNKKALDYLIGGLTPSGWRERGITWKSPLHASNAERDTQLARMAIMGAALSGNATARGALQSLLSQSGLDASTAALIREAIQDNELIAKVGITTYYRQRKIQ